MVFEATTVDDIMNDVLSKLLTRPFNVTGSRAGADGISEIIGASIHLENPRARLSLSETRGKPFSTIGELIWYLSGSDETAFIKHYIRRYNYEDEDGIVWGAYGPRLFSLRKNINQIQNIIDQLKEKPSTKQAVIQIFDGEDLVGKHKDIPCTCTWQFLIRKDRLHMITHMRSNDAFYGLAHDIFSFTMFQEIIARTLEIEVGFYKHFAGSLHLYQNKEKEAQQYLAEGFQSTKKPMPPMPLGNPWEAIQTIVELEKGIRSNESITIPPTLDSYWKDIVRLLQIHKLFKDGQLSDITPLILEISNDVYKLHAESKLKRYQRV